MRREPKDWPVLAGASRIRVRVSEDGTDWITLHEGDLAFGTYSDGFPLILPLSGKYAVRYLHIENTSETYLHLRSVKVLARDFSFPTKMHLTSPRTGPTVLGSAKGNGQRYCLRRGISRADLSFRGNQCRPQSPALMQLGSLKRYSRKSSWRSTWTTSRPTWAQSSFSKEAPRRILRGRRHRLAGCVSTFLRTVYDLSIRNWPDTYRQRT